MKRQPFLVPSINDFILSFTGPSKAGTALSTVRKCLQMHGVP